MKIIQSADGLRPTRRMAHWRVAKVARELAGVQYEELAKDNFFYKLHPDRRAFIEAHYAKYLETARRCLAGALQSETLSEQDKAEIVDALVKDNAFVPRAEPRTVIKI